MITALLMPLGANAAVSLDQERGCRSLVPSSVGGEMPSNEDVMVLRYLGHANYELTYKGQIILLDTFYDGDRSPGSRMIGITSSQVRRANAIVVGHPHGDHIVGTPEIANRTGATVIVAPAGAKYLRDSRVASSQIKIVRGGETIKLPSFTVQVALGIHSMFDSSVSKHWFEANAGSDPQPATAEENAAYREKYLRLGSRANTKSDDPEMDVITHGSMAYILTFDDGTTVAFRDTPGAISDSERAMFENFHAAGKKIDIGIIAYQGPGTRYTIEKVTMPFLRLYKPSVFLPAHQDENQGSGGYPDISTRPLFEVMREEMPDVRGVDPLYRAPICFNTKTRELENGAFVR